MHKNQRDVLIMNPLFLYEEVLLLILKDKEGTVDWKAGYFRSVLAGAMIAELLLLGKIEIDDTPKQLVKVIDTTPTDEALLDEALVEINSAKKEQSVQHWVNRFTGFREHLQRIARGLCSKGILKETEEKVLLFFTSRRFPEVNPEPEREVIERMRQAIFTEMEEVDIRTCLLISLCYKSNILSIPFSNADLKHQKDHIESIIKGDKIGEATKAVIQAIQTVIIVATVVPIIVST